MSSRPKWISVSENGVIVDTTRIFIPYLSAAGQIRHRRIDEPIPVEKIDKPAPVKKVDKPKPVRKASSISRNMSWKVSDMNLPEHSCSNCNRLDCPEGKGKTDSPYKVGNRSVDIDYIKDVVKTIGIVEFLHLNPWCDAKFVIKNDLPMPPATMSMRVNWYLHEVDEKIFREHPELRPKRRVAHDTDPEPDVFQIARVRLGEQRERHLEHDRALRLKGLRSSDQNKKKQNTRPRN